MHTYPPQMRMYIVVTVPCLPQSTQVRVLSWSFPNHKKVLTPRHDPLCKACTDRELVYSAKRKLFNNRLCVRYVHLIKAKPFINDKPILSSERLLHKDYNSKGSGAKKIWSWISRGMEPRRTDWRLTSSHKVIVTVIVLQLVWEIVRELLRLSRCELLWAVRSW
jgi:hypothetical protein